MGKTCLRGLVVLCLLAAGTAMAAITSIDIPHERLQKQGRTQDLEASLSSRGGNAAGYNANAAFLSAILTQDERHLWLMKASGGMGKFGDVTTESGAFAHLRHQYRILSWLSSDAFVQIEKDRFQRLRGRTLEGGGPAFWVHRSDKLSVRVGTGVMHEIERYNDMDGQASIPLRETLRSTSYMKARARIVERVSATLSAYFQPNMGRASDIRALADGTVDVEIGEGISLRLNVTLRYDSEPPAGVKGTDLDIGHGFVVSL